MSILLSVRDLEVRYGQNIAVREVSLQLRRGEITTVIGANGAGKTSLLAGIMGLVRRRGQIVFEGRDISCSQPEDNVRRGIVMVPERRELFGPMSVLDNLILGGVAGRLRGGSDLDVRLADVFRRYPRLAERRVQAANTLSGGERQMLALGRALMARPTVLLLDEPSLGLAPNIVRQVFGWIREMRQDGIAILLVEQNARTALDNAQYAYVMDQGRFFAQGPSAEIRAEQNIAARYLGWCQQRTHGE
jgi:branched-chain amino acid transport system ATP-binding protein